MDKPKPVAVTVLKHHTWRGTQYEPGQTYHVEGDASQTAEQYLDTLRATGFARPVGEEGGPNYVEEIGEPGQPVAPLTTENVVQEAPADAKPVETKPAAAKAAKKPATPGGKKK